ncbi:MAG: hypothetical protein HC936_19340 [Leptolyngbyaceae cyanobacterium SU_3_3]|nr:hypothetical protein [Leptolyngbyaceae cyanobacterium SU_3_3]
MRFKSACLNHPEAAQALATTPWGGRFYGRSGFPPDLDRRQPYSPLTHRSAAIAHSIALRTNMSAIENHKTDPAPRQTRLQSAAAEFSQVSSVQQERVA